MFFFVVVVFIACVCLPVCLSVYVLVFFLGSLELYVCISLTACRCCFLHHQAYLPSCVLCDTQYMPCHTTCNYLVVVSGCMPCLYAFVLFRPVATVVNLFSYLLAYVHT